MLVFTDAKDNFDLYNSLMARLFIYAPLILLEYNKELARTASNSDSYGLG